MYSRTGLPVTKQTYVDGARAGSSLWSSRWLPWIAAAVFFFMFLVALGSRGCKTDSSIDDPIVIDDLRSFDPARDTPRHVGAPASGARMSPGARAAGASPSVSAATDKPAASTGSSALDAQLAALREQQAALQAQIEAAAQAAASGASTAGRSAGSDGGVAVAAAAASGPRVPYTTTAAPPGKTLVVPHNSQYDVLDETTRTRRDAVKEAMKHAWEGYRKYAWGQDELRPQSNSPMNWLGLGATIVDSLDTLWIMGMHEEFKQARDWVEANLDFDRHLDVSVFETTIRVVGGLCAAYDLSGDEMFLRKSVDLARRLLQAFNTGSGIPFATVNLKTGGAHSPGWTGGASILSEMGTLQLEFKHLAHHTQNKEFHDKVERIIDTLDRNGKPLKGLYPLYVNVHNGGFSGSQISFGALGDSFYEYLIKQDIFVAHKDNKYRRMFDECMEGMIQHLIKKSDPSGLVFVAEWNGNSAVDKMDHLACFVGGMLAIGATGEHASEYMKVAEGIGETCYQMYARQATGVAPEFVYFRPGSDLVPGATHNLLRPEAVETFFVLWRKTHDPKWREYGWKVMDAFNKHSRTDTGFAGLRDVTRVPAPKDDQQQSFFLAETLKYLYLLFSEDSLISLDEWVFNTEAHPLRVIEDYRY